jgi:hypothetical protein
MDFADFKLHIATFIFIYRSVGGAFLAQVPAKRRFRQTRLRIYRSVGGAFLAQVPAKRRSRETRLRVYRSVGGAFLAQVPAKRRFRQTRLRRNACRFSCTTAILRLVYFVDFLVGVPHTVFARDFFKNAVVVRVFEHKVPVRVVGFE